MDAVSSKVLVDLLDLFKLFGGKAGVVPLYVVIEVVHV